MIALGIVLVVGAILVGLAALAFMLSTMWN